MPKSLGIKHENFKNGERYNLGTNKRLTDAGGDVVAIFNGTSNEFKTIARANRSLKQCVVYFQ